MPPITTASYASPEDAEAAFYDAVQAGNLVALMQVFAEDEEIVCVHPNGQRMVGHAAIQESWRGIFSSGRRLQVTSDRAVRWASMLMSVHNVVEHIAVEGSEGNLTLAATNVYIRGASGWRILVHHSSAIQSGSDDTTEPGENGHRVLH